jgi:transposase
MIQVAPGTKLYLACRPVSMRYGFDGLAAQAKRVVDGDPFSGHLFLFPRQERGLPEDPYYDGTGLCVSLLLGPIGVATHNDERSDAQ